MLPPKRICARLAPTKKSSGLSPRRIGTEYRQHPYHCGGLAFEGLTGLGGGVLLCPFSCNCRAIWSRRVRTSANSVRKAIELPDTWSAQVSESAVWAFMVVFTSRV